MGRTRPGGAYLAPGWTVPLCRACHRCEHRLRAILDLDSFVAGNAFEAVEAALRRAGITLGRSGEHDQAVALVGLAERLAGGVRLLDTRDPGWRRAAEGTT